MARNRNTKTYQCECGSTLDTRYEYNKHRRECDTVKQMVFDELRRLANELGRPPTQQDYIDLRNKDLPGHLWITDYIGSWPDVIDMLGVADDNKGNERLNIALTEIQWISETITAPYAPNMTMYRKYKRDGTPKAESVLADLGVKPMSVKWRIFIKNYLGLEVQQREAQRKSKPRWDNMKEAKINFDNPHLALSRGHQVARVREDAKRIYYELR